VNGIERIAGAFAAVAPRAALMPYLMGGYPDLALSRAIGEAYVDAGADLLELGVPFSDPLADGPVIHAAGTAALRGGATFEGVLDVAATLAPRVPVVLMVYANALLVRGYTQVARALADSGACGVIVPDLPLEEASELRAACEQLGVAVIGLVAPTTPPERLREIGAHTRGFLYTVSVTGTTGERGSAPEALAEVIARARASTTVPVAVGFGIGTPAAAAGAAAAGADGVIVGSRLVRAVGEARPAGPDAIVASVGKLVSELRAALEGAIRAPAAPSPV
jgi:tryptophan synthase alpha chain